MSQVTEKIVSGRLPILNIGGVLLMLSDPLVQEALLRLTQRFPLELPCDLIPEFLDEANSLVGRQPSEGLNDLLGIHPHVTSHHDRTADSTGKVQGRHVTGWTAHVHVTASLAQLKHFGPDNRLAKLGITTCIPRRIGREGSPAAAQARFSHIGDRKARRLLPDKGKLTVRWGRKATDQAMGLMAGLPKEGRTGSPGKRWSSATQGDHCGPSEACPARSRATPGRVVSPRADVPARPRPHPYSRLIHPGDGAL